MLNTTQSITRRRTDVLCAFICVNYAKAFGIVVALVLDSKCNNQLQMCFSHFKKMVCLHVESELLLLASFSVF